jgi:hypothetical protein
MDFIVDLMKVYTGQLEAQAATASACLRCCDQSIHFCNLRNAPARKALISDNHGIVDGAQAACPPGEQIDQSDIVVLLGRCHCPLTPGPGG